jgi:pimeloyl-ACP methyl ester carboxylesterase/tetratricopeptide (TPR) repeat protein
MLARRSGSLTRAIATVAMLSMPMLGCASLSLGTDTASVDGKKYLFIQPWMHYTVEGSGPPVVLVHGFPGDLHTWRRNVNGLAKYFTVFALDLAGFGASVNPYKDYSLEFFSSQVGTFIRELDLGPTIVVGHSVGGAIALDSFLRFPKLVRSVVLINSAGFDVPGDSLIEDIDRMGIALHNFRDDGDIERVIATVVESPLKKLHSDEKFVEESVIERFAAPLRTSAGREAALMMLRNFGTQTLLSRIMAKADELRLHSKSERRGERDVLVIWGDKDPWFPPRMAEHFRARIPGAKVAILKDTGHFAHVEQPEAVNGLIVDVMLPRPAADNRYSIHNYDADYLIERGRKHKRRKEWDMALEAFNQALDLNPYLGLAYYEIGDMLFQKQQFAESIEMLRRSLEIYPDDAVVHYRMGTTYHNQATILAERLAKQGTDEETILDITQGKLEEALISYERSAELDPSKTNPWYNLGRLYSRVKNWKDAGRAYGGLAKADPSNVRARRLQVDSLLKAEDFEGAGTALEALAQIEKGNSEVFAMLGRVKRDLGDLEAAENALDRAVKIQPNEPRYALDLALVQIKMRKFDEGRISLDRVLRSNPGDAEALSLRASLAFETKDFAAALKDYDRVLKSDSKSMLGRLGAARCHLALERPSEASSMLEGVAKTSEDPLLLLTYARALAAQWPAETKTKQTKKLASVLAKRIVKVLGRALDLGVSSKDFRALPELGVLNGNKGYKALLKRKPPAKEAEEG